MNTGLLTTAEAAEFCGMAKRTFFKRARNGNGPPAFKTSQRHVRYAPNDLMQWLESYRVA